MEIMKNYYAYSLSLNLNTKDVINYSLPRLFVSKDEIVFFLQSRIKTKPKDGLEKIILFSISLPIDSCFIETSDNCIKLLAGSKTKINETFFYNQNLRNLKIRKVIYKIKIKNLIYRIRILN